MKNFFKVALPALFSMGIAASVMAQPAAERPTVRSASPDKAQKQQQVHRVSRIIGASVRDTKDRKIGEIKDMVLDGGRGEIAYAVVSFGGVMGVGQKYHAIPWQVLKAADNGMYYVLNADRETISQAPGFDKGDWPDMADSRWSADIERYWSRKVGRGTPDNGLSSGAPGVSDPQESGNGTK